MWQNIPLWPDRASSFANNVDALYIFLIAVCGFFTLLVFALVAFFALKYRERPGREATQIEGSLALEATWTLIPFGLFMIMFVWGASSLHEPGAAAEECDGCFRRRPSNGCGSCSIPKACARSTSYTFRWVKTCD